MSEPVWTGCLEIPIKGVPDIWIERTVTEDAHLKNEVSTFHMSILEVVGV